MNKTFIQSATDLLNSISSCNGEQSQLAHKLSQAIDKLDAVISHANAQFSCGDSHATFNKNFIENLNK